MQNFGGVTTDDIYVAMPHPDIRVTNGVVSYLHHDQLGSVVLITDAAGALRAGDGVSAFWPNALRRRDPPRHAA